MIRINEIQYVNINDKETIIVNLINGLADVISKETEYLLVNNCLCDIPQETIECLIDRNYLFEDESKYREFVKNTLKIATYYEKREAPNFLFIPTYNCNLCCGYCYQRGYSIDKGRCNNSVISVFFEYVKNKIKELENLNNIKYSNEDIVITLMGGEPLMLENKDVIKNFVENCMLNGYQFDIITNGITIKNYIDIISVPNLKSVQITLDGDKSVHDRRRVRKDGYGTFDAIMESITLLLSNNINVQLRINIDSENIDSLIDLSNELKPLYSNIKFYPYIFLLEHEGCMGYKNVIEDHVALKRIYEMRESNDLLKKIDIAYIGKEIVEGVFSDKPYYPTTRKCASSKNQYIYDLYGNVYKCWWGIGNKDFRINIGDENLNDESWKGRQIMNIKECSSCKYRFLCGGGCVGRNIKNTRMKHVKGECHDFEKLLDVAIKGRFYEKI